MKMGGLRNGVNMGIYSHNVSFNRAFDSLFET